VPVTTDVKLKKHRRDNRSSASVDSSPPRPALLGKLHLQGRRWTRRFPCHQLLRDQFKGKRIVIDEIRAGPGPAYSQERRSRTGRTTWCAQHFVNRPRDRNWTTKSRGIDKPWKSLRAASARIGHLNDAVSRKFGWTGPNRIKQGPLLELAPSRFWWSVLMSCRYFGSRMPPLSSRLMRSARRTASGRGCERYSLLENGTYLWSARPLLDRGD